MNIIEFLNRKFSLLDSKKNRIFLVAFTAVFLVFYLNIYTPFNMEQWAETEKGNSLIILTIFALIAASIIAISQFVFRKLFNQNEFTIKTYLIWFFLEMTLISLLLTFIFSDFADVISFSIELAFSLKLVFAISIIPNALVILILSLMKYKKQMSEKEEEIEELLIEKNKVVLTNELINLPDDKGSIKFSLPLDDILYLESTDNYVFIYYISNDIVKKELLRNSLKKLENVFENLPLKRCHRSYMVNLNNLTLVKKSGQKMMLSLSKTSETIPVSKTYQKEFNEFLHLTN